MFLRRAKTGDPVYCTLKPETVEQVLSVANPRGRYVFLEHVPHEEKELERMVQGWGGLM